MKEDRTPAVIERICSDTVNFAGLSINLHDYYKPSCPDVFLPKPNKVKVESRKSVCSKPHEI